MKVLFLCTGNSARSQMAEAFMRSLVPERVPIEVFSAGTAPREIHEQTTAVMQEVGLDLSAQRSKPIEDVPFESMDIVVTLCGDARETCPAPPAEARAIHWDLRDPAAAPPDEAARMFRAVRDEILVCVKRLLFELATDPSLRPLTKDDSR